MPITFKKSNAVSALIDGEVDYLLNCVNCQGKYASGIAKEIGTRIPTAIRRYNDFYRWKNKNGQKMLGDIAIDGSSGVVHLAAQEFYGYDGKQYVDYIELDSCLKKFSEFYQEDKDRVAIPYGMCAGLAGGDWETVLGLIQLHLKDFNVKIYELGGV